MQSFSKPIFLTKVKVCISLITVACSTGFLPAQATIIESNIPEVGQRTQLALSAEKEKEVGNTLMRQLRASDLLSEDRVVNVYLESVAKRLAKAADHLDFKLHLFAVNSPELNAFTFFGGHIAVHTGLISALKSEDELAGVLAHETAHIAQRHLARILTTNKRLMPLTYAELLAAVAIGALGAPEAGSHLATAVMAGHMQQLINFTRDHEQEADRIGIQILVKAGYDPQALPAVLRTLSLKSRFSERPPEYLLTHPVHEARIADCTNRVERLAHRSTTDNLFFYLVSARIQSELPGNIKQRVKQLGERLETEQASQKPALQYAYTLALIKNKQYQTAEEQLTALSAALPSNWLIDYTKAELELAAGRMQNAIERLKSLSKQHPDNDAISVKYAEALLQNKQGSAAEQLLLALRRQRSDDPEILQLLVQAYSQLKRPTALHQTQAEWHASRGEYKEAFQQLDIALEDIPAHSHQAQTLRLRKQALQEEFEQQKRTKL